MTPPVFTPRINWRESHTTTRGYLTDVITADDDTEQRMQLRTIATRLESFTVSAYDDENVPLLDACLYARQGTEFLVPSWPDVTTLTAAVSAADTSLPCDTTDRGFTATDDTVTGYAVLYASPNDYELVTVTAVASGALTVLATANDWPIGTLVLPARLGWLAVDLGLTRLTTIATDVPVAFEYETVVTYGVSGESGDSADALSLVDGGDYLTYGGDLVTTDTQTYLNHSGDLLSYGGDVLIQTPE